MNLASTAVKHGEALALADARIVEQLLEHREHLVIAHQAERRRLERDLHDGAQREFVTASLHLGAARAMVQTGRIRDLQCKLDEVADSLELGLSELRRVSRGLHPVLLADFGLPLALESLAGRSAVPASAQLALSGRYQARIEETVYYFVSEALTNAAKHARASRVVVRAREDGGRLFVDVTDDGVGGADMARGSGLRGLRDRLAALHGKLTIDSPPGRGTTVTAALVTSCA